MLLTLFVIVILLLGIYNGARRGFALQVIYAVGYAASYYIANRFYMPFSKYTEMFIPFPSASETTNLVFYNANQTLRIDTTFYRGISFVLLLLAGIIVTRLLGYLLKDISFLPILSQANSLIGAVIGLVINYVGVFVLLTLLSLVPVDAIQKQFVDSQIAYKIVTDTPYLSDSLSQLWWLS